MAKQIFQKFDVEFRKKVTVPTPETDDEAVNKAYVDDAISGADSPNKANTDGSNTIGGTWQIEKAQNAQVGDVFDSRMISVVNDLGISANSVISDSLGLVFGGTSTNPSVINENGYDNFIYKVGEATNYPSHVKKGNYIVESKNRYRSAFIDTLSDTDGTIGKVIIEPFNGIEHQYYEVEITDTLTELEILLEQPINDEISGNQILRNAHGQKVTLFIKEEPAPILFIDTFLNTTPTMNTRGIYTFYYDAESEKWDFGGYQEF